MGHMGQIGQRVTLTEDLTKYGEGLVPGLQGTIGPDNGEWSRGSDRFVWVRFDNGMSLDVLRKGLKFGESVVPDEPPPFVRTVIKSQAPPPPDEGPSEAVRLQAWNELWNILLTPRPDVEGGA